MTYNPFKGPRSPVDLAETYCRIPFDGDPVERSTKLQTFFDLTTTERQRDFAIESMLELLGLSSRLADNCVVTSSGAVAMTATFASIAEVALRPSLIAERERLNARARSKSWAVISDAPSQGTILMASPGIPYPYRFARRSGFDNVIVSKRKDDTMELDVDDVVHKIETEDIDLVYLESPSNILGSTLTASDIRRIYSACQRSRSSPFLVIDNCFALLTPPGARVPLAADILRSCPGDGRWVMLWDTGKTLFRRPAEKLGFAVFGNEKLCRRAREWVELEHYEFDSDRLLAVTTMMRRATHHMSGNYLSKVVECVGRNVDAFFDSELSKISMHRPEAGSTVVIPTEPEIRFESAATAAARLTHRLKADAGVLVTDASPYFDPKYAYRREDLPNREGPMYGGGWLRLALAREPGVFAEGLRRIEALLLGRERLAGTPTAALRAPSPTGNHGLIV